MQRDMMFGNCVLPYASLSPLKQMGDFLMQTKNHFSNCFMQTSSKLTLTSQEPF